MELYFITINWAWTSVKKTDSSSILCTIFKCTNNICQKFILVPFIKWNTQVYFYFRNLLTGTEHVFKRLTHHQNFAQLATWKNNIFRSRVIIISDSPIYLIWDILIYQFKCILWILLVLSYLINRAYVNILQKQTWIPMQLHGHILELGWVIMPKVIWYTIFISAHDSVQKQQKQVWPT